MVRIDLKLLYIYDQHFEINPELKLFIRFCRYIPVEILFTFWKWHDNCSPNLPLLLLADWMSQRGRAATCVYACCVWAAIDSDSTDLLMGCLPEVILKGTASTDIEALPSFVNRLSESRSVRATRLWLRHLIYLWSVFIPTSLYHPL